MNAALVIFLLTLPWAWPIGGPMSPSLLQSMVTIICVCCVLFLRIHKPAQAIVYSWLLAAAVNSFAGMAQWLQITEYFGGLLVTPDRHSVVGNIYQGNLLANLTNIGLVTLIFMLQRSSDSAKETSRNWHYWVVLAAVYAFVNALTGSRIGLVGLLIVVLLAWYWGWWRQPHRQAAISPVQPARVAIVVAVGVYLLTSAGLQWSHGNAIFERVIKGNDGCQSRLILWSNMLELVAQKPWTGWGWGNLDFAHFMHLYAGPRFCAIPGTAHNIPLHLAVELGVIVSALVCSVIALLIYRARPWAEKNPQRQLAWTVLLIIGLHSLVEQPLWASPYLLSVGLCIWWLWAESRSEKHSSMNSLEMQEPTLGHEGATLTGAASHGWWKSYEAVRLTAALVLMAMAYVLWDYNRVRQVYIPPDDRSMVFAPDPLRHARHSFVFAQHARFAILMLTPMDASNVAMMRQLAQFSLRLSPEPRVIEKQIQSAAVLGEPEEVVFFAIRYKRAFPKDYARWARQQPAIAQQVKKLDGD
jgi:O-antigen ligase